jgi:hypothetical protein
MDSLAITGSEFSVIMGALFSVVNAAFAVVSSMWGHVRPGNGNCKRPAPQFARIETKSSFKCEKNTELVDSSLNGFKGRTNEDGVWLGVRD